MTVNVSAEEAIVKRLRVKSENGTRTTRNKKINKMTLDELGTKIRNIEKGDSTYKKHLIQRVRNFGADTAFL